MKILALLFIIAAYSATREIVRYKTRRKQFIATLREGQHIKCVKETNGRKQVCHTTIKRVVSDYKIVLTPIGMVHFEDIRM